MSVRVLHVQDHTIPEMSGYAIRSRYLVKTEHALGVESEVVSSARHQGFSALVEELEGIRFHRTPRPDSLLSRLQLRIPFWRETVLVDALRRRILDVASVFEPDLLHAHSPIFNGMAALRAGRRLGIPVVYQIRAFWEDDAVDKRKFAEGSFVYRQVRRLETRVCERADRIVTICSGLKADLVSRGIPDSKITVVDNGVDPERFRPIPRDEALAKELGLGDAQVAGFVGSFFNYEGLPMLVEAAARLFARHPRFRLMLVGTGEAMEETRARAAALDPDGRILFTGRVPHDRVGSYYSLIDLLVYPRISKRITELVTPLKPLEALAMGKQILGSDVGGIRELVADCGAGSLFRAGSVDDLERALSEWIASDQVEREREQRRGVELVGKRRRWEDLVARLLPVYDSLKGPVPERVK